MCEKCGHATHLHEDGIPRRKLLLGGAGLMTAAPILSGIAGATGTASDTNNTNIGETTVQAFGAPGPSKPLVQMTVKRRAVGPKDVAIDILYASICHSDIHTVRDEWGPSKYPCVPGHEIVGRVRAVGRDVRKFKVGDYAGIGCLVDSCGHCDPCRDDLEQYCENHPTFTYQSPDKISGGYTQGGYSTGMVVTEHFAIRIPPGADLPSTAPLLCAGITTFSPINHWKIEKGQRLGVIGMGGLGHMAVKLAVARQIDVTVFTSTPEKAADAKRFGAKAVVISTDRGDMRAHRGQFDYLISTVPQPYPMAPFIGLMKLDGTMINVGAMQELQQIFGTMLIGRRQSLAGSMIGGIAETQDVVDYCFAHHIRPEIKMIDPTPEEINNAINDVVAKKARYRFVIDMTKLQAA